MVFLFNKYAYLVIISTFTGSLTLFAVYVKMNVESVTYMVLQTFFLNLKILLFKKNFYLLCNDESLQHFVVENVFASTLLSFFFFRFILWFCVFY